MALTQKINQIQSILDDFKAQNVITIPLEYSNAEVQAMVIATATSNTHAKSLGNYVKSEAKQKKLDFLGMEGEDNAQWILVDLNDVVVHIMLADVRALYQLESLWSGILED